MRVLAALLLCAFGTFALRAQTNSNFYLKADSGVVFQPNISFKVQRNHVEFPVDPGERFDFAGGYRFTDWCAGELETGVVHTMWNYSRDFHRDYFQVPFLANCVFNYPYGKVRPFVGGGVGIVEVITDPYDDASIWENHTTFGCQAIAGITYPITRRLDFGINYKFLYSSQFTIPGHYQIPAAQMGPSLSHTIAAALVYHF